MAAKNHLNKYQFRYRPTGPQREWLDGDYFADELEEGHTLYDHKIDAVYKPTGEVVGQILYHMDGPMFNIQVEPEHQRRGVATGMVLHGQKIAKASKGIIPRPQRAYSETDAGAMFAEAMERKGIFYNGS